MVEDIEFPGVLQTYHAEFPGVRVIKNNKKYLRETKKNSCKISRGLGWFLTLKFLRHVTYIIVPNFQGWNFLLEISTGTEKKSMSSTPPPPAPPPPRMFDLNWSYEALAKKEALAISQGRAFASFIIFVCSIIIISFRKVHTSVL